MSDILYSFIDELTSDDDSVNQLIESLLVAEEGETITMTFRSCGGCVATMTAILNAMKLTKAKTVGILLSHAFSAATFVFLACDEKVVCDHSCMMFHPSAAGMDGSWADIKARSDAYKLSEKSLVQEYYSNFLTPKEIKKSGRQEVWLSAEQIRERLVLTSDLA